MPRSDDRSPSATPPSASSAAVAPWSGPFHWPGGGTACLLIHGFTATPQEMRFLGERLHAAGHTVYGARVAGHATSVEDLERASWRDWYASVSAPLAEIRRQADHVVVVGQSMGSLLALALAAQHPEDIAAVVLLAPALVLQQRWLQRVRSILPLVARMPGQRFRYLAKGRSDIADPAAHVDRECYDRIPLRAVHQLLSLQRHARRQLPRVRQPVLVVHSHQDHSCSTAGIRQLERELAGSLEIIMLDNSYHVVSVDFDRERVASSVDSFATKTRRLNAGPIES